MALLEDEAAYADLALYDNSDSEGDTPATKQVTNQPADHHVGFHSAGFKDFLLKPELLRAIADSAFEHPSEVQHQCIPQAILGTDVLCQARSGMGKTAVFVLSVLQQLDPNPAPGSVLVLCHARELAYQIRCEFDRFKKHILGIKTAVFYGGVPVSENKQLLRTEAPHIIVGTPGRILELAQSRSLSLNNLKHFVLDECDHMLDQVSMRKTVQDIFKLTPRDKQVMMFSATLPDETRVVAKKFMHEPLEIYGEASRLKLHGLQQYFVALEEKEKNRKLIDLLDALEFNQLVVFVSSVSRAVELTKLLVECNFPSSCLHSGLDQAARIETYKKFKEFKTRIMVATNLIGRGIDIERINVVINYDMPDSTQLYLHRVARAGRFGTKGLAISFVSSASDKQALADVQSHFAVQIPQLPDEIDASTYIVGS